ncbi:MAG: hypothetical protein ACPGWS_04775 [Solirubrobacterales bacterium]
MTDQQFSKEDLQEVIEGLGEVSGFDAIEGRLEQIAPQLQQLLDGALKAGGWFDDAHESVVLRTATVPDQEQRIAELRNFVLEQTRLGMLVGVAVGWEISERLDSRRSD